MKAKVPAKREHDGDDFRQRHQLLTVAEREVEGVRRAVIVNDAESPLGWLKSRKDRNDRALIGDDQYAAGERLRADYWFAHLSPRVTSNWSALAPAERTRRTPPRFVTRCAAGDACADGRWPEVSGVPVDFCCELKGLEDAEKKNG